MKLGFHCRNKSCFPLRTWKGLIPTTICHLSVAILYMSLSPSSLQSLTPVYHCALRFITGWSHLTHHCELHSRAGKPSLNIGWYTHWMTLVYKALLGPLHFYLFIHFSSENRRQLCLMLKVHSMLFVWEQKRRRKLLASLRPLFASWAKTVRTCFIERFRQNKNKKRRQRKSCQQCLCFKS